MLRVFAVCIAVMLAGCTGPVTDVPSAPYSSLQAEISHETGDILEKYVTGRQRLLNLGAPLMLQNAALCPRRALTAGFMVHSDFDVPEPLRDAARGRLNLGADATVLSVFQGTAAHAGGLVPNDILLTINGQRVRNAADARARIKRAAHAASAQFGFLRDGRAFTLTLPFVPICDYKLVYLESDRTLNAWTDGKQIFVTQGMLDFTNDRELAVVLGHELAHDIMHHTVKNMVNTAPIILGGGIIDGMVGTHATEIMMNAYTNIWSPRFELEADYVGLYLLARAGGDIDAAALFWRRMAAENGIAAVVQPAVMVHTHPAAPERFSVIAETAREISAKTKTGAPLVPNLRDKWNFGQRYSWWSDDRTDDDEPDNDDLNH